jgi:hypothetical protein
MLVRILYCNDPDAHYYCSNLFCFDFRSLRASKCTRNSLSLNGFVCRYCLEDGASILFPPVGPARLPACPVAQLLGCSAPAALQGCLGNFPANDYLDVLVTVLSTYGQSAHLHLIVSLLQYHASYHASSLPPCRVIPSLHFFEPFHRIPGCLPRKYVWGEAMENFRVNYSGLNTRNSPCFGFVCKKINKKINSLATVLRSTTIQTTEYRCFLSS